MRGSVAIVYSAILIAIQRVRGESRRSKDKL
jgi:hypothetical protein